MKAIVLAAGHGTRLMPYTLDRNKTMLPLWDGKPVIGHVVDYLVKFGFEPIIAISRNTHEDQISNYFSTLSSVHFSAADRPSGTAGEVYNARGLLKGEKNFLVYYGDTLANVDLDAMRSQHESEGNMVTLCGAEKVPFGLGLIERPDGRVKLIEKPDISFAPNKYPNCPIFYIQHTVLDYIEDIRQKQSGDIDFSKDVIPALEQAGEKIGLYVHTGYYHDVGTHWAYERVKDLPLDL